MERWGEEVAPNGEVDRERVGRIVFGDRAELDWLESVLHPRVGAHVLEWRQNLGPEVEVAVVEVPLLFEAAMEDAFDATVAIVADDEVQGRPAARTRPGAASRAGRTRQLDQAEKVRRADHAIRNDASLEELESVVSRLIDQLRSEARDEPRNLGEPARTRSRRSSSRSKQRGRRARKRRRSQRASRGARDRRHAPRRRPRRFPAGQQRPLPAHARGGHPPAPHEDIIRQQAAEKESRPT